MKRFCAGLLALATAAGGLAAQEADADKGKFSWSGSVKLGVDTVWNGPGTRTNAPQKGDDSNDPLAARSFDKGVTGLHGDWNQGDVTVKYTKGAMELSSTIEANYGKVTGFNTTGGAGDADATLQAKVIYGDGVNGTESNWKLQSQFRIFNSAGVSIVKPDSFGEVLRRTWGYYLLFDRQLKLEAAWRGNDESLLSEPVDLVGDTNYDNMDNRAGIRVTFNPKAVEGLRVGFAFHNGNAGIQNRVPDYGTGYDIVWDSTATPVGWIAQDSNNTPLGINLAAPSVPSGTPGKIMGGKYYPDADNPSITKSWSGDQHWFSGDHNPTVADILGSFAFGVKYDNGPISAAAGFRANRQQLDTYKWNAADANITGSSLQGISGHGGQYMFSFLNNLLTNYSNPDTGVSYGNEDIGSIELNKSPGVDAVYLGGKYTIMEGLSAGLDVQLSGLSQKVYIPGSLYTAAKGLKENISDVPLQDGKAFTMAHLMLGAQVNYDAEPLHAGLQIKLRGDPGTVDDNFGYNAFGDGDGGIWFDKNVAAVRDTFLQFSPYVKYDIIPKTLQVHLPINFAVSLNGTKDKKDLFDVDTGSNPMLDSERGYYYAGNKGMYLWLAPALYWNLKGDAATDDPSCGIVLRYYVGWAFGQYNQEETQDKITNNPGDHVEPIFNKTTNWLNGLRCTFRWTF